MTKKLIIYCLICLSAYLVFYSLTALSSDKITSLKFDSPQATIQIHLSNLQKDNFKPDIAAKALNSTRINREKADDLAIKLKRIFDGKGLMIQLETIPNDNNYIDSTNMKNRYVIFPELPEIYLEKYGQKWLYSLETVSQIEDLYRATFPIDTFSFIENLPDFWRKQVFEIYIWQIAGFILFALICYSLYFIFSWIFGYLLVHISSKLFKHHLYRKYISRVSKPLSIFLMLWVFGELLSTLGLPTKVSYSIGMIVRAIQPILITIIFFRLSEFVVDIFAMFASKTKSNVDDHLVPFLRKGLRVVIIILGTLYFFKNIGVDITPLIAGVSIGGLAFALAAQDTVKNLFGSLTIFTDQPFQIGDWIVFEGVEGTVEEVGIRSTRIRTFYNSLISVPNGKLADTKIDNMGKRQYRRYVTKITVTYDTPPELIDAFVIGLRRIVENHWGTRKDYHQIHLNDLGSSSIQILFYIFFDVPDWTEELKARHEIISEIMKLASLLGIRFAFPTQTLHIEDFPEKTSMTPIYDLKNDAVTKLLDNYEPFKS